MEERRDGPVLLPGEMEEPQQVPHAYFADNQEQEAEEDGGAAFDASRTERPEGPPPDVADSRELGVNLAQLQEFLAISVSLRRSCGTLPLTLMLWLSYLLVVFYHSGSRVSYQSANYVRAGIEGCQAMLPGEGDRMFKLADLNDYRQVMPWIDRALVPMLQVQDAQQVVLGHVRVRQHRGENSTCGLAGDLEAVYQSGCYPASGSVMSYGPRRPRFELAEPAFITTAKAGGVFDFWLEVNRSKAVVSRRIAKLEAEGWLDLSTQSITVEGLFLNVEEHVYSHFTLELIMPREGGLLTSVRVNPLRGEIFSHWAQVFLDIGWMFLFVVLLYAAATELMLEIDRGLWRLHIKDIYFWLDVSLLLLGASVVINFYVLIYYLDQFTLKVFELGVQPALSVAESPDPQKVLAQVQANTYQASIAEIVDWVAWFVDQNGWLRFCSCLYASLMVFRFFRGFSGQPRIAVLVQTFLQCTDFVLHFVTLLAVIIGIYSLSGYILFGDSIEGWGTAIGAVSRTLLIFFMRFDYQEFHKVSPVAAAIWFSSFFLLVVVLLQRLMAAAVVDTYVSVRAALGEPGLSLVQQARQGVQDLMFLRSYRGAQKSVPLEELLRIVAADADPEYLKKLGSRQVDRRLRTRDDLSKVESSPSVDVDFLLQRGCDRASAERLLRLCAEWTYSISVTSSPVRRLLIMLVRQMHHMRFEAEKLQETMNRKFERSAKVVDRIDLKHAKCYSLARRIRKGQQLPPGWTAHTDKDGRRFLRQTETGLTSWTLPKHLL